MKKKIDFIKEQLGVNDSFDIGYRHFVINNDNLYFFFLNSLSDSSNILQTIKQIINSSPSSLDLFDNIKNNIISHQFNETTNIDKFIDEILCGKIGIYLDCLKTYMLIDLRQYPTRSPQEPDTERVVRGSRDGFVENIAINIALTRRRIRTKKLITKLYKVGVDSKTDICLCYISDLCDMKLVESLEEKIKNIEVRELSMSDKALEELLFKQRFNPYPLVRYTERPDNVASHLFQGLVAIFVDTSPSVMLAPITFFDHLQHAEEYRQTPIVGTFIRLIRFGGVFLSLFLVPFWLLVTYNPEYLPSFLDFIGPKELGNIPVILQILIAEIGIEFLRMAAIHTPNPLSTAMGLIAGILVGEIAINVGLFMPEIVLYIAVSQIGSYATPSYELSLANKISKIFFVLCAFLFKLPGLIISIFIWLIYLASLKSVNKPYLYPLVPFNFKELMKVIIRFPKETINKK